MWPDRSTIGQVVGLAYEWSGTLMIDQLPPDLLEAARCAQNRAYAPYSKFRVGAALVDEAGRVHVGCNVECGSYGLTVCAERNAVAAMVAAGGKTIGSVVIVSDSAVTPCGACRQVLAEFADDAPVWLIDSSGRSPGNATSLSALLPMRFKF